MRKMIIAIVFISMLILCLGGCVTFDYDEFVRSETAERRGIENIPNDAQTANGRLLYERVLNPIRKQFPSLRVTSGFRNPHLNEAVGGVANSQHLDGEAVDFIVWGTDHSDVIRWIQENLEFDQLIDEPGWIHISYRENANRNQYFFMR